MLRLELTRLMEMLNTLVFYFGRPFVRYALVVGIAIALCSSLFGSTLVLRRFSFIGDGLAHVAFGVTAVATALSFTNNIFLVMPITIICAILLLKTGQRAKIKGDASLAMLSVGSLAIGYLIMNIFSRTANLSGDVCSTLFGSTSFLTLSLSSVWLSIAMSALVITTFLLMYHKIFSITFDEDFSIATGTRSNIYNLVIAVVIAVIIVLAMNLVGALLVSALVVFPALSAMRLFKSFKSVTICSVVFSVICTAIGFIVSILASTPVGATIVAVDIGGFGIFNLVGYLSRRV